MSEEKLQRMLDHAVSFFLAAERCEPEVSFGNYGLHSLGAPPLVLYGFSVEIALKILLELENKGTKGHTLQNLFERLSPELRMQLPYVGEVFSSGEEGDNPSKYFEEWRYAYEKDLLFGSPDDIRRCFIQCHALIRGLKPEICSIFESNWGQFKPEWLQPANHPAIEVHNRYV